MERRMDTPNADDRTKPNQRQGQETGFIPQRSEGLIEQSGQRYIPGSAAEPPPVARHAAGPGAWQEAPASAAAGGTSQPSRRSYEAVRGHFAADFTAHQGDAAEVWRQGRPFAHAEPNYRAGYDAGIDLRHDGRTFEEIEPELRHEYETRVREARAGEPRVPDDEATWLQLREEIRVGFDTARAG